MNYKILIYFILIILIGTNLIAFLKLTRDCDDKITNGEGKNNQAGLDNEFEDKITFLNDDIIDFEEYDNKKPSEKFIIPNLVHLIYLNITKIAFYQAVNIYSVYLNQQPDRIYIYCDLCPFNGYYWSEINSIEGLRNIIRIIKINVSNSIFEHSYSWIQHK